jgi:hypothetical protein
MKSQPAYAFDKLYWARIGSAVLAGALTEALQASVGSDWSIGVTIGIGVYLLTYYAALFSWYRGIPREQQGKVYSTGIGGFVMAFLFTWILLFTLQTAGYSL